MGRNKTRSDKRAGKFLVLMLKEIQRIKPLTLVCRIVNSVLTTNNHPKPDATHDVNVQTIM